ncbi:Dol-P-Man:Man(6)GlcNAc(2)-PP-Dol alpha-1,2-mannosyltransferase [Cardamine amara subsp. amara]|uniref:Dol-P-Man:Man(6)GlcNAc(2)-PP-Dol alpha-1,2-mannosyltransferase n=1 Tax=Cardamine amara subsp. amara TaxID=228776 RepID=A0ABD1BFY1_CARAN
MHRSFVLKIGSHHIVSDNVMVVALSRKYGKRLATYAVAMLCLTSGCFFASTSEFVLFSVDLFKLFFILP